MFHIGVHGDNLPAYLSIVVAWTTSKAMLSLRQDEARGPSPCSKPTVGDALTTGASVASYIVLQMLFRAGANDRS
jgi:hypothetical protein